ncbi:DEAD/DEAH box helicase [Desulfobulbus rhabdoformis]|uniref:DEAD/DEAH box helicase n=1 Tax=Desulfobulbus rhabdoformis TaxID=34032 RepID=UPI0019662B3D|nr:DEAD/DEAH box helicase [Desulfobulbus rhabdoformis]MBM9615993.1 DEAD/DEAH box helicase [Desulfobulbus rhabdoformis]
MTDTKLFKLIHLLFRAPHCSGFRYLQKSPSSTALHIMYIVIPPDSLPPFLPLPATFLLSNWFDRETLDQGYALLQQAKITQFFFYRNSAAGFIGHHKLTLFFRPSQRIESGFTLQDSHCTLCKSSSKDKRCAHLAALCILSLHEHSPDTYHPFPLLFKQSIWGNLADFLFTWLGKGKEAPQITLNATELSLMQTTNDGSLRATLSRLPIDATELLAPEVPEELQHLFSQMQNRCTTSNEQQLIKVGATSKGLQHDASLWTRLCRAAFSRLGDGVPTVTHTGTPEAFVLSINDNQAGVSLAITLPRANTVELLKKLGLLQDPYCQLPDARCGSDISPTAEGTLRVSPIAWLPDDRCLSVAELHQHKFGPYYYLPQEGFIRLSSPDSAARIIIDSPTETTTPLFAFLQQADERIVEQKNLATFLEHNQEQLHHPDNRVAPEVFAMRCIHTPDRLILTGLQEEQGWIVLSCRFGIGEEQILPSQLIKALQKRQPLICGLTTLQPNDGPLTWLYQRFRHKPKDLTTLPKEGLCLTRGEFACLVSAIPDIEHQHNVPELQQRLNSLSSLEKQPQTDTRIRHQKHLREYQKTGLSWMYMLYQLGMGGLLADDMGLGKTHQAMALIDTVIREDAPSASILVVCPASVLLHWADKLNRFYPDLGFALYYGPERNLDISSQAQIILTTYAIIRADAHLLSQEAFQLIVYDEIQALKNRRTATHQACRSLHSHAVFGLSGTPIENSLADLFSIFAICLPGFFGRFKDFQHTFLTPIEKYDSLPQQELLTQRITPFVLRRTRSQVLTELPELIENNRSCCLSSTQAQLYQDTLAAHKPLLDDIAEEIAPIDYLHVFAMMTRLKQICDHPCLVEQCADPTRYKSGKWDLFVELLDEALANGRKVVVFSQYLAMLSLMEHYLESNNIGFAELRGDMAVPKRQAAIERFANDDDCRIFLASLLAGGTGIDLVAGNVVIHYDRWWNPAKEEQATARVHRMGQKEPVDLFRLTTENTLEEKIDAIIADKRKLSDAIINEDDLGMIKQLSREELLALFSL